MIVNSKETDNNNRNELSSFNNGGSLLNLNACILFTKRRYNVGANSRRWKKDGCCTVRCTVFIRAVLYYGISAIIIAATKKITIKHIWSFTMALSMLSSLIKPRVGVVVGESLLRIGSSMKKKQPVLSILSASSSSSLSSSLSSSYDHSSSSSSYDHASFSFSPHAYGLAALGMLIGSSSSNNSNNQTTYMAPSDESSSSSSSASFISSELIVAAAKIH